jgi:hypothetical protein
MALLFKSGDEHFDQGVDLVKRKEYDKAKSSFEKTIKKGGKEAELSGLYIAILDAVMRQADPGAFENLAAALGRTNLGNFEFGLTEVDPAKLAVESRLTADRLRLIALNGNIELMTNKGNKLLELAQKYQVQIGNNPLKIYEITKGDTTTTGLRESLALQALGFESLAGAIVFTDPKKAAEQLQNAYNCRRQLGDSGDQDMRLIKSYSKSVKCWLCGRPSTGEGVHFLAMSSDITPFMRATNDDLLKSAPETFESVYVCRPCYTAVSRRADEISKVYYDRAITEMRAMEARLQAEIASVRGMAMMSRR